MLTLDLADADLSEVNAFEALSYVVTVGLLTDVGPADPALWEVVGALELLS